MPILYFLLAWFVGLWLASLWSLPAGWLWSGVIIAIASTIIFWRQQWRWLPLCLLGLCLASWRFAETRTVLDEHHLASYHQGEEVMVTGRIVSRPDYSERSQRIKISVEQLTTSQGLQYEVAGLLLVQTERYPPYRYGQALQINGLLTAPQTNAEFDYRAYLARQGIHSSMSWPDIIITGENNGSRWGHILDDFQEMAESNLRQLLPDPHGALLRGILLGNDDDLSPELSEAFQLTGLTHIIAISGFNIALLASMMLHLATPLVGPRWAVLVATVTITIYTILVGADASVVRAALMGGIGLFSGRLLGRTTHGPTVLLLVAMLMTAFNPDWLWDVGFQLSFAATLSLMLYADPLTRLVRRQLQKWLPRWAAQRILDWISEAVLLTLAAQILTLPLMLLHFGQLSLISLLANALVLPAQPAVMIWGGATTLLAFLHPAVAQPFAWLSWLFLEYTISLVELLATVPGAAVAITLPPVGIILLYLGLAGATWWSNQAYDFQLLSKLNELPWGQMLTTLCLCGTILLWIWSASLPDGRLHIYFLDIGQGDATLIQTPAGQYILIDGGQFPARLQERLSDHMPFWQRSLDLVVVTHADADHVGGLPGVVERYAVDYLLTNGEPADRAGPFATLIQQSEQREIPLLLAEVGQKIWMDDDLYLEVLHPGPARSDSRNDNSVVLRLVFHQFSLLLTGDIEESAENVLVERGNLQPTYALKVAHHGSDSSTIPPFLAQIQPMVAIISVGADNQFGHPHRQVVERFERAQIPVLRTDQLQTIEFITDGSGLIILTHP